VAAHITGYRQQQQQTHPNTTGPQAPPSTDSHQLQQGTESNTGAQTVRPVDTQLPNPTTSNTNHVPHGQATFTGINTTFAGTNTNSTRAAVLQLPHDDATMVRTPVSGMQTSNAAANLAPNVNHENNCTPHAGLAAWSQVLYRRILAA